MRAALRALGLLSLLLGACGGGRSCGSASPPGPAPLAAGSAAARASQLRLRVPHAAGPIKADGELDEVSWREAGRTESFLDQQTNELARPYSDARLLWDEQNLYFALYAADEDIKASGKHDEPLWLKDAFSVRFAVAGRPESFGLELAPNKAVTDFLVRPGDVLDRSWESGITFGVDLDGSLNDEDEDEEWVIEAALPWSSLGITDPRTAPPLTMTLARCDTPRDGHRRCSSWGAGVLEFTPTPPLP
jgi:hypothetical protein